MGFPSESAVPAYRTLRLLRKHWQVLGVDLNRSELVQEKPPNARAARWSAWLLLIGPGGGSEKLDGAHFRGRGGASDMVTVVILGTVEAPDAQAAKAAAAVQFELDEIQRNRIIVQELA
jgi:hypothetical protein